MKIDYSGTTYDPLWYDKKSGKKVDEPAQTGVFFKIRQYPASMLDTVFTDGGIKFQGEDQCRKFKYCLCDWKGVTDLNGKPLPCNDDVKQKIFDFKLGGIADFVMAKIMVMEKQKADSEKN